MSVSRRTSAALAGSAVLLLTVAHAAPAAAMAGAGSGVVLGPNGRSLSVAVGIQRTANYGDGNGGAVFECAALSTGDVAVTSLTQCALVVNGGVVSNQPLALPGPSVASGGVSLSVPTGAWVQVCASATSTYVDASSLSTGNCTAPVQLPSVTVPPTPSLPSVKDLNLDLNTLGCRIEDATGKHVLSCPLMPPDLIARP